MQVALSPGSTFGTYSVRSLVGAGGMGEVYRAHDSSLRRDVALEVLPQALATDVEGRERLPREARSDG